MRLIHFSRAWCLGCGHPQPAGTRACPNTRVVADGPEHPCPGPILQIYLTHPNGREVPLRPLTPAEQQALDTRGAAA